ncbi:amidase [Marinobacter sp. CHS3-4]|uniref:amidase n=1 Tax=Marinobacter sp. CHS3-4 TaxID=3045174 RepID=UPI0024B4F486|nr:amidase [Marinobacter sp. CHS3-4]MDI9246030.1 amidase [Marinobacter sp. CHS3-4]
MAANTGQPSFHTFRDDALGQYDATELADLLKQGKRTSEELIIASLERARLAQPQLNALVTPIAEGPEALSKLMAGTPESASARFTGIPTAIKDNTDVQKFPTTQGTDALQARPAQRTSPFADQLLAQGLVCIGKTTLPEFGFNATTEPAHREPTRNPWHTGYSTGASSGGSAALVAAGVLPIAHANDGGGSIRIPAACCGLVGLKPSRGRLVDNDAAKSLPINIVADGVVTRSVRDTANFYHDAEHYYRNPRLPSIGLVEKAADKPLRIGLILDSINGKRTDDETRQAVESTAKSLAEMGHHVEEMPMPVPDTFPADFALYWGMLAFGVRQNGKRLFQAPFDRKKVDGLTVGLDKAFKKRFYRLPAALWRLRRSYHDYARAMAGFDAVLTPVLGHTTPEIGYLSPNVPFEELFERLFSYVSFTPLANTTGAPAIALPGGQTSNGLPIGIQLMGKHGGEKTLLELAFGLEEAQPWPTIPQRESSAESLDRVV